MGEPQNTAGSPRAYEQDAVVARGVGQIAVSARLEEWVRWPTLFAGLRPTAPAREL